MVFLTAPTPGPPQRPASTRGKLGQALPHKGGGENSEFLGKELDGKKGCE